MGLFYPNQIVHTLIGSKTAAGVISGIELESSYQAESATEATKTFDVGGHSRVEFAIAYTTGSGETNNSIEVRLEYSPDAVNFYQLMNDSTSAGVSTLTAREFTFVGASAATTYKVTFGVDIAYKDLMRISVKETGVESNKGSVYVEACLSGK